MAARRLLPLLLLLLGLPLGSARERRAAGTGTDRCRSPPLPGRCRASIPRWFFNSSAGSCEPFVFGGCGGNRNNFGSERECRESCGQREPGGAPSSPVATNSTLAELCSAPPVTGPCRAAFPRWYYIPAERSCREFTYGGCRGNSNNHLDREECLRRCRPPPDDPGAEFRKFFSSKGVTLGALLAAAAALFSALSFALRRRRRKSEPSGATESREDRQCLMKDPYPA